MLRLLHGKPHWCALSSRSVSDKFGSSFLSGPVRVVSFTDAKGTALTGDTGALIKALTGGDVVEDRGPHAQLLVSIPGDKVFVLVSNSPPKIDFEEDVDAWVRRVRPYRFQSYHVERRVPDFAKVLLRDEGSAILNRLIEGARRRMQLMIAGKRPEMKPPMVDVLNEILNRSCAVSEFCESRIVAERGGQVNRTEFYNLFTDWQIKERGGRVTMARDEFNKRAEDALRRKFGASLSHSCEGGKGWRGLRWKTDSERDNGD